MDLPALAATLTSARWRFATTMPQWPHVYTVRDWWDEDDAFTEACALIEERGRVLPWPRPPRRPRYHNSYLVLAPLKFWGLCCVDGLHGGGEGGSMKRTRRPGPPVRMPSGFTGFGFPPEVILLAVRWYLRYGLSYRDLEELLAERGIEVDHVTLYRWVQRFTPLLIDAARPVRHLAGDRWFVDETYVKVAGVWRYVYRAVDQDGQVIDVYVSRRRDIGSARTFFTAALSVHGDPGEVITDRAPALANVVEELLRAAWHNTGQYENNRVECDHGRLKARLRPMRGVKTNRTASVVIRGHAFIQNLRRGHYELAVDAAPLSRLAAAFDELRPAI